MSSDRENLPYDAMIPGDNNAAKLELLLRVRRFFFEAEKAKQLALRAETFAQEAAVELRQALGLPMGGPIDLDKLIAEARKAAS